jgi:hypothetical protein
MMKEQPPGLTMRNTEPFIDPITGKPEEYVPNKPAEEAPKTPNTAGTQKAQARVDDYRSKNWAPDDTIDMGLWNKQAGAQGGTGAPSSGQQAQMFGQFGDPKKAMGSIWDQIKGVGGGIKKGISALDAKMDQNYKDMGYAPKEAEKPWSINDIEDEQWHNRKDGVLVDPNDPEWKQKLMELSRDKEGIVQPDRQKELRQYYDDFSDNSLAVEVAKEERLKNQQEGFDKSILGKASRFMIPGIYGAQKHITPRIKNWYSDTFNKGGYLTEKGR